VHVLNGKVSLSDWKFGDFVSCRAKIEPNSGQRRVLRRMEGARCTVRRGLVWVGRWTAQVPYAHTSQFDGDPYEVAHRRTMSGSRLGRERSADPSMDSQWRPMTVSMSVGSLRSKRRAPVTLALRRSREKRRVQTTTHAGMATPTNGPRQGSQTSTNGPTTSTNCREICSRKTPREMGAFSQ